MRVAQVWGSSANATGTFAEFFKLVVCAVEGANLDDFVARDDQVLFVECVEAGVVLDAWRRWWRRRRGSGAFREFSRGEDHLPRLWNVLIGELVGVNEHV